MLNPKDKRVTKSDEWLHEHIMDLFLNPKEQSAWKLDEVEKKLNHPRAGIVKMMNKLCTMDNLSKKYTLKPEYRF